VLNGEAKGVAVVVADAVGDVKEAGLAGTEGGAAVVEDGWEPALADGDVEAGAAGPDAGEEVVVVVAGAGDIDAAAAVAAMVPPRSHGFGGEAIFQIGGPKVGRTGIPVDGE